MTARYFIKQLACLSLLGSICLQLLILDSAFGKSTDPNKPNFLLLLVDDMAWSATSVQMDPNNPDSKSDYHQTPNLEMLAQQGMVFSNAYAAGPMCSPTRVSIQTGKTPAGLQTTDVRQASSTSHVRFSQYYANRSLAPPQPRQWFPAETTLGEQLKDIDPSYRTGWYGKWDWWPNPNSDGYDVANDNEPAVNPPAEDPRRIFSTTNLATSFLDASDATDDPFFLITSYDAVKGNNAKQSTIDEFEALTPGIKHDDPVYAAMHKDLDEGIGTILDRLDTMGVADNTYVMFVSDHGAAIGINGQATVNEPLYGGKGTIWEGGLRVPMIVRGPGITGSSHTDVPVSTIDLFPTIHDLAGGGVALPQDIEGTSIAPVLFNSGDLPTGMQSLSRANGENGELYFHYPHYGPTLPIGPTKPASAIRDGDYKLVRIFGENGAPDEHLLFDLSSSLEESNDPSSPLNLASLLPEKVDELSGKLSNWFQAVDASIPYDVRTSIQIDWMASQDRASNSNWQSVQDVDFYDRENWIAVGGAEPQSMDVHTYQPGLQSKAFRFDGSDSFRRRFFHVADKTDPATGDADHSASFEFWFRVDDLSGEQLLFEAGSSSQGLSLTLGDADGDSTSNDMRFRVLDADGQNLTVTAPIDTFSDPTSDFVHVAAVLNDSQTDRYIELYVNGALVGRVQGVAGSNVLNWDSFAKGSLGRDTDTIGGSSGSGDLPFTGGNLRGEVAAMRFENYAITSNDVLASYNSKLDPVNLGVAAVNQGATKPVERPSSVAAGTIEGDDSALVILERNDTLDSSLTVDHLQATGMAGALAEGTPFASYLIHFDPIGTPAGTESVVGSVTFAGDVLGIIWSDALLTTSDGPLGSIGEYELGGRGGGIGVGEFVTVSPDGKTLNFMLSASGDAISQLRVLTTPGLAGDYNGDGVVNLADYNVWRDNLGASDEAALGWLGDGEGGVDSGDYNLWKQNFGASALGTALASQSINAVPEPSSLLLVGLLLSAAVSRFNYNSGR